MSYSGAVNVQPKESSLLSVFAVCCYSRTFVLGVRAILPLHCRYLSVQSPCYLSDLIWKSHRWFPASAMGLGEPGTQLCIAPALPLRRQPVRMDRHCRIGMEMDR